MQPDGAQAVVAELMSLARDDKERLTAAKDRLTRAREEVTEAQSAYDSANVRSTVSDRVAHGAAELLPGHAGSTHDTAVDHSAEGSSPHEGSRGGGPGRMRPTLAAEILGFVRGQGRPVRRSEITEHLRQTRPDLRTTGVGPELTERVRAGMLTRTGPGMYDMPARGDGGDGQKTS
ncbi:hypothetical protein [Streptomyces canus]|uniref:hypothetical protein n=1 Tax=Streptomyces canus TaxID=58343 RepID=UPI003822BEC1